MKKISEIREYDYKGVKVCVHINYRNNIISLVELNLLGERYEDKKWVFARRGVEYMDSWLYILDAMKYAVTEAKKEYESELARVSAFRIEEIVKIEHKYSKLKEKNK